MADKKLSLEIGGKDIVLNFGTNWFFEYYKQDCGHDLVKDPNMELVDLESVELFKYLQSLIWAGYRSECSGAKIEQTMTRQEVEDYVMSGDYQDSIKLVWQMTATLSGKSVEDLQAAKEEAAAAPPETEEEKKSELVP